MRVLDFGPGAGAIPGPEVLAGFDPTQHRLVEGKAIAQIPGHPDYLVRWFPGNPEIVGLLPADEPSIENHVEKTQMHLQAIREQSKGVLDVPSHRSFAAPHPSNPGRLAVMTIIERVEGASHSIGTADVETAVVVYGLARYLRWAIQTDQPEILSDIFNPTQFLTGRINYIVDTDGILSRMPSDKSFMKRYVQRLATWRQGLADTSYAVAADAVIQEVQNIIKERSVRVSDDMPPANRGDTITAAIEDIVSTLIIPKS